MHTIKPKKRRVLGELKRSRRLTLNLTREEHERLAEKSKEAGMSMTVYVRRVCLAGQVIARMSMEDRELFRKAVGLSNVLEGLYKMAKSEGLEAVMAAFAGGREAVDKLINKLRL